MSSVIEQIKSKLGIVDVVGSYIKLERAGSNFKARCPFHNEKTPSFFVSPSRETYHCFGCNRGGDILSFVQEIEGLDFRGALKTLADRAGVRLTETDPGINREREKMLEILEAATKFFEEQLGKYHEASRYVKERGVTEETIKNFRIGFAPDEWHALSSFLAGKKFSPEIVEKAGLVVKGEKGYYDRFRRRIMFPIADGFGKIVGFSGRILPGGADEERAGGKYVNSPENTVFHKSKILFGFDKAKQAIRRENAAVLVEGQMDLILSHQAGVENTVASSGTALTRDHLVLLRRLADTLILAFDADEAGVAASKKGVDLALGEGFDVKVVALPEGLDPADLAKKDSASWKEAVENAQHIIDFYLKALLGKGYDMRLFRKKTSELVLPYIAKLKNSIDQAHFVSEVARALSLSEEPIWEELKRISSVAGASEMDGMDESERTPKTLVGTERRRDTIERKILGILFWQRNVAEPAIDLKRFIDEYRTIVGEQSYEATERMSAEKKNDYIFEAEVYYQNAEDLTQELELLLANFEQEVLREQFVVAMDELRMAELKGDTSRSAEILKKCQEISKKLNEIVRK
jgi:DNA primase